MIETEFEICLVCGADVLSMYRAEEIAMCAQHSNADKLVALDRLEKRIRLTREGIEQRQEMLKNG